MSVLAHRRDPVAGNLRARRPLKFKRSCHDSDHQEVALASQARDFRRRAASGATAHARGHENHVGAVHYHFQALLVLNRRFAALGRIRTRPHALGDRAAYGEFDIRAGTSTAPVRRY